MVGVHLADFSNMRFCKPGLAMIFSVGCIAATLSVAILHIVAVRAEPQMGRPEAGRSITGVTNIKSFRDWTVNYFPRHSVNNARPAFVKKLAVPSTRSVPWPIKARIAVWRNLEHLLKQFITGKLVSHLSALPERWCMTRHRSNGAASITLYREIVYSWF